MVHQIETVGLDVFNASYTFCLTVGLF